MLEEELGRMAPDLGVIEEWKRKDTDYTTRLADLQAATAARNEARCLSLPDDFNDINLCTEYLQSPYGQVMLCRRAFAERARDDR